MSHIWCVPCCCIFFLIISKVLDIGRNLGREATPAADTVHFLRSTVIDGLVSDPTLTIHSLAL